jgi:hypothetical protein
VSISKREQIEGMSMRVFFQNIIYSIAFFAAVVAFHPCPPLAVAWNGEEVLYPTLISVRYETGAVVIGFEPISESGTVYRIYRSTAPIKTEEDLLSSDPVVEIAPEELPYTDKPNIGDRYYYAVTVLGKEGERTDLVPFQNSTLYPVDYSPMPDPVRSIKITQADGPIASLTFSPVRMDYTYSLYISSQPIDLLDGKSPDFVLEGGKDRFAVEIQEETPFYFLITTSNRMGVENRCVVKGENTNIEAFIIKKSEEESKTLKAKGKKRTTPKKKQISVKSLIERNLKYNFNRGYYSRALMEFNGILKRQDLSFSQQGAVYFYMGQCCFYTNDYKSAIRYFILSKSVSQYKNSAELWIERCFEMDN